MVTKHCPKCEDNIPIACKTCPCGYKFSKTVEELNSTKKEQQQAANAARVGTPGDKTTSIGTRPRRKSAMNSLYFTTSLQMAGFKLSKQAARYTATQVRKRQEVQQLTDSNGVAIKRARGRPRLQPKPEPSDKPQNGDMNSDKLSENSSDSSRLNRSVQRTLTESEQTLNKLYNLPPERKTHFTQILTNINSKFIRNAGLFTQTLLNSTTESTVNSTPTENITS